MSTMNQSITGGVLEKLGFVPVPDASGRKGGPQKYTVTADTVSLIQGMRDKTVTLNNGGTLLFEGESDPEEA